MPKLTLASVANARASMKRSSSSRVRMDSMVMIADIVEKVDVILFAFCLAAICERLEAGNCGSIRDSIEYP